MGKNKFLNESKLMWLRIGETAKYEEYKKIRRSVTELVVTRQLMIWRENSIITSKIKMKPNINFIKNKKTDIHWIFFGGKAESRRWLIGHITLTLRGLL